MASRCSDIPVRSGTEECLPTPRTERRARKQSEGFETMAVVPLTWCLLFVGGRTPRRPLSEASVSSATLLLQRSDSWIANPYLRASDAGLIFQNRSPRPPAVTSLVRGSRQTSGQSSPRRPIRSRSVFAVGKTMLTSLLHAKPRQRLVPDPSMSDTRIRLALPATRHRWKLGRPKKGRTAMPEWRTKFDGYAEPRGSEETLASCLSILENGADQ